MPPAETIFVPYKLAMQKKILLINGHPNKDSFNFGIAKAYKDGAAETGAIVRQINIRDLAFNPNLAYGYQQRTVLEPDLEQAWEAIKWADHLVWIYPVWWGGLPAITKGFIDRVFLPGMAFQYRKNSAFWDKLLLGKTAHIISTLDQPGWYYRLVYGRPSTNQLRKSTLEFCGIKPVKTTYIAIVKTADESKRQGWLNKVFNLGKQQK